MRQRADRVRVRAWWRRWPDSNIGIVTGRVSGLAVLDVDPRSGGDRALGALEAVHGALPPTVESLTGGGGRHYWFALPDGLGVPSGPLRAGLDLKAEGGMAIAPPSRHVSGRRYRWLSGRRLGDAAIAPLPAWIVELAASPRRSVAPAEARELRPAPPRTPGERTAFAGVWARAGITLRPGDHTYLCPFHDDHRPSLHIDAEGCRWYCFGCQRGGGIGALRRLMAERSAGGPRTRLRALPPDHDPSITLPGSRTIEVVGESAFQDDLLALTGGLRRYGGVDAETVAELVPVEAAAEAPDGDTWAVQVRIRERPVGWLRAEDARGYRAAIDEAIAARGAATCRARIRGGWDRGAGRVGAFGVRLLLPEPA